MLLHPNLVIGDAARLEVPVSAQLVRHDVGVVTARTSVVVVVFACSDESQKLVVKHG